MVPVSVPLRQKVPVSTVPEHWFFNIIFIIIQLLRTTGCMKSNLEGNRKKKIKY
jgi:hypothetical protein